MGFAFNQWFVKLIICQSGTSTSNHILFDIIVWLCWFIRCSYIYIHIKLDIRKTPDNDYTLDEFILNWLVRNPLHTPITDWVRWFSKWTAYDITMCVVCGRCTYGVIFQLAHTHKHVIALIAHIFTDDDVPKCVDGAQRTIISTSLLIKLSVIVLLVKSEGVRMLLLCLLSWIAMFLWANNRIAHSPRNTAA